MHGEKSAHGSKFSKRLTIAFVLVSAIFLCIIAYWWVLAPIISRFFISEDCVYHDPKYYTEENYLDFEDGDTFQAMLSEFGAPEQGEIIDFYYVDNYIEDNPIRGKMCDIYALDVVYQEEKYLDIKSTIAERNETPKPVGDYTLFASVDTIGARTFVKGIAFCDEKHVTRYVLVTDLDTLFLISNVFDRHSNLCWENKAEGQKTGDGVAGDGGPVLCLDENMNCGIRNPHQRHRAQGTVL